LGDWGTFTSNSIFYTAPTYDSTNQKIVISYRDNDDSYYGKTVVGEVSGYTITGTDLSDDLKLRTADGALAYGPDRYFANNAPSLAAPTDDVTTGNEVVTSVDMPLAYNDWDDEGGAGAANVNDGDYDEGQDIYQEDTGGALTYSPSSAIPETVVYNGGATEVVGGFSGAGPGTSGSPATYLEIADNIWYRDHDHDTMYDLGEFLVKTSDSTLDSGDEVLQRADGGGDWIISNGNDMYRLKDDYSGGNPGGAADNHYYFYIDDNDNDVYDNGEAIVDQIDGNDLTMLEESDAAPNTDFILHHGYADLTKLPMAASAGGSVTWKFKVPSVNDRNNPLELKVVIALEDAAETGFYTISTDIVPTNV